MLPHSVPKGTKSGRASLKTRKGRASSKPRQVLVIIKTSKASLNLKRALWGDKPEGLLPENCPNFLAGTIPKGAGETEVFSPSGGKFIHRSFK
jgi:hypothetical protein